MVNEGTNVTTGEVRLSYVHLFKPYSAQPEQDAKYSVTILIPKTDVATKARIDAAIAAATQRGSQDKWNGVVPPILKTPLSDGDGVRQDGTPFGPECRGHWIMTARSSADRPPEVVDAQLQPILNQSEVCSGIYGRVNVEFFPYFNAGNKGIGCSLGCVQKLRDGESLGGSAPTAAEAFGAPAGGYGGYVPQAAVPQAAVPQAAVPQAAEPAVYAPRGIDPITGRPL